MLFLILATIASAGNALTMKYAGSRSSNTWALLLFNYLTATLFSALSVMRSGLSLGEVPMSVLMLGTVTGVLFIAGFALLQLNVRVNGATVSSSLTRLASVIALLLSIVLFGEYPTPAGALGIVVAIAATVLLSMPKGDANEDGEGAPSMRQLLIPMVVVGGIADSMPKVFERTSDPVFEEAFILMTFATAFVICLALLLRARERPVAVDVACGVMLGTFNFFSTDLMVRAMMELPAYVVYTGFSLGVVLITYAANALVLHERLDRRDHVAIVLVLLALVLINLPR